MDEQKIRKYIELRQTMHYIDDPAVPQYKAFSDAIRSLMASMTVAEAHSAIFEYRQWFAAHVQIECNGSDMSLVDQWLHARHELSVLSCITDSAAAIDAARLKLSTISAEMDLAELTTASDIFTEDYVS